MSLKELAEIATAILASLGGGGAIVFGLSSYLGKVWADRGLEKQRHDYSQLNIAFQSQLEMATRRLQVELDALALVHKLRTQEEFTRLAGLWKHIANLRNYFAGLVPKGLTLGFEDPQEQARMNAQIRHLQPCFGHLRVTQLTTQMSIHYHGVRRVTLDENHAAKKIGSRFLDRDFGIPHVVHEV
jgi:hypothetical protein